MADNDIAAQQLQRLRTMLSGTTVTERLCAIVLDESVPLKRRQQFAHLAMRAYGLKLEVTPPAGSEPSG